MEKKPLGGCDIKQTLWFRRQSVTEYEQLHFGLVQQHPGLDNVEGWNKE